MTLEGSGLEAIEKINKPFNLRWHPGSPGRWEAILDGGEEIRASSVSPNVAMAIVLITTIKNTERQREPSKVSATTGYRQSS